MQQQPRTAAATRQPTMTLVASPPPSPPSSALLAPVLALAVVDGGGAAAAAAVDMLVPAIAAPPLSAPSSPAVPNDEVGRGLGVGGSGIAGGASSRPVPTPAAPVQDDQPHTPGIGNEVARLANERQAGGCAQLWRRVHVCANMHSPLVGVVASVGAASVALLAHWPVLTSAVPHTGVCTVYARLLAPPVGCTFQ